MRANLGSLTAIASSHHRPVSRSRVQSPARANVRHTGTNSAVATSCVKMLIASHAYFQALLCGCVNFFHSTVS